MGDADLEYCLKVLSGQAPTIEELGATAIAPYIVQAVVELIDQETLGVAFEFHRSLKLGILCSCLGRQLPDHKY